MTPSDESTLEYADADLFNAFVESGFDLLVLAKTRSITPADLLLWIRKPAVKLALQDFLGFQALANRARLDASRLRAVEALATILDAPAATPIERRRAGVAITRAVAQSERTARPGASSPRSRPHSPPKAATLHPAPSIPPINPTDEAALLTDYLNLANRLLKGEGSEADLSRLENHPAHQLAPAA